MVKRTIAVIAVISLLSVSQLADASLRACGGAELCSEQWDWCEETAEYFYGEYRPCCTGFCRGPLGPGCSNDSNQCRCVDIGR